jgi:hypothetical protein
METIIIKPIKSKGLLRFFSSQESYKITGEGLRMRHADEMGNVVVIYQYGEKKEWTSLAYVNLDYYLVYKELN